MAATNNILVQIQDTAKTFAEVLTLASKIYVRIPKSQSQYKWIESTYGLTSPSFDKKLYLTKNDLEYYSYKKIWILSPNDKWGIVREFTRREDYIVSSNGVIVDKSNDPWLKVAIGTGGNMIIYDNINKHLITMALALDQLSSSYALMYSRYEGIIYYEFQGNESTKNTISKLLKYLATAKTAAGPLAPTVPEMFLEAMINETSLFLQEEDVIEIREGIVVDKAFVLSPNSDYLEISTIGAQTVDEQTLLDRFAKSSRGNYVVMAPSYGPWILVHPKLINIIKQMITQYGQIVKQNIQINGVPESSKCEEMIDSARNAIMYVNTDAQRFDIDAYDQAVKFLGLRTNILSTCNIAVPQDPFKLDAFYNFANNACIYRQIDKVNFQNGVYSELYLIPTHNGSIGFPVHITDATKIQAPDLKVDFYPMYPTSNTPSEMIGRSARDGTPWLVLKRNTSCAALMYFILAKSLKAMVTLVPDYKNFKVP